MLEKKDMNYNFNMIMPRLFDSFEHMDIASAKKILNGIKENCICIGTGGSNSVSFFASIILDEVNKIVAVSKEPRDILHMNLSGRFNYLLGITYGNNNHGINEAISRAKDNNLSTHLITTNSLNRNDICYKGTIKDEYSFISLASTIIPMSIMLNYYLDTDKKSTLTLISDIFKNIDNTKYNIDCEFSLFEIMSGDNTYVSSKILESTITESGIGIPVVHEKYGYCHGRSTMAHHHKNSTLIYLINGNYSKLDNTLLSELKSQYKNVIILSSKQPDKIIGEFDLAVKALFLCEKIAEKQNKDLSTVEYSNVVKKLYKYDGEI